MDGWLTVPMAPGGLLKSPSFVRFWIADAASCLGTFISGLALQLLLIETLHANQAEVGLVRAAQWLPMLLFGMLAGVAIDRLRRRPVLIASDVISSVLFAAVAVLAFTSYLTPVLLAVLVFAAGTASMFFSIAHQTFLPSLVPRALLASANARIEQTWTGVQSVGPAIAGILIQAFSAPFAVLVDAISYAVSAVLLVTVKVDEKPPNDGTARDGVFRQLREGARWVYRHRTLAPYAVSLHLWFFFNSVVTTVLVFFAVRELHLAPAEIGIVMASTGLTGVLGAGLAPRLARRLGIGWTCIAADWLTPLGYVLVLTSRPGGAALPMLIAAQLVVGLGLGLKGPPETTYRVSVTPDRLRGRMNATIRSVNWGSIAVSAPLSGWAATTWGNRPVILAGIVGLAVAAGLLTMSPYRFATLPGGEGRAAE